MISMPACAPSFSGSTNRTLAGEPFLPVAHKSGMVPRTHLRSPSFFRLALPPPPHPPTPPRKYILVEKVEEENEEGWEERTKSTHSPRTPAPRDERHLRPPFSSFPPALPPLQRESQTSFTGHGTAQVPQCPGAVAAGGWRWMPRPGNLGGGGVGGEVLSVTIHSSSWGQPDPNLLNKKHSVKTNSTHLCRNCADAIPGPEKASSSLLQNRVG